MKPAPFTYHRPRTRDDVDRLLAELGEEAKVLAGGQSLIPVLNMRLGAVRHLLDVNHLADEPRAPRLDGGALTFGPLVRHEAAERSPVVAEHCPVLRETIGFVAHPAIRSRGTVVGSVAHADPAAELPPLLVALEGEAVARGVRGRRTIPAHELFAGHLENTLAPDEWLEEVRFPVCRAPRAATIDEFARRHGDYALCSVVAVAERDGDAVRVALTYGGMGPVPLRVAAPPLAPEELEGPALDDAVAAIVGERLEPEEDIHASVAYRTWLARRLGARAARRAGRAALAAVPGATP
ncbi:MAG TPA: FAD binding domain-containing protein [Conexibacter sp.]|nr:FAD binding domain-containing protein [Conexibacter sp.]